MPLQLGPSANTEETRLSTQESTGDTPDVNASETQQPTQGGWLDQFRAENSMLPNILMGVGMIVVVFVMIRSLRKTHKSNASRTNAMGSPSERIEEIRHRAITSMEPAEKLMVEAEEIARRLGAALDNKAARLELLIEEADAKLDQLNRAISNQTKPTHTNDSSEPSPAARPAPRSIDPSLLDRARLEQDQHEREARVAGRIEPTNAEPEPAEIPISDQIQELALKGKSPHEIAHQLKQPIGQVELILNLQRRAERS